jgi:SAM-dependent methyltransferase
MSFKEAQEIRADFDRIARLSAEDEDALGPNQRYLLRHAPAAMAEALEVGCGTGAFTRHLARRAGRVMAIDLSPVMVEVARRRSPAFSNIEYVVADATASDLPTMRFDCVASIDVLHHMPLRAMLLKMIGALRPGGVLLIGDLLDSRGLASLPRRTLARVVGRLVRRRPVSQDLVQAWADHGRGEARPHLSEIKALAAELTRGARVTDHLLWGCYSIVWKKPR